MPELESVLKEHRDFFSRGGTRSVALRILFLQRLRKTLKNHETEILQALRQDLGKSDHEGYMTELGIVLDEIGFISKRLTNWAKPRKVRTVLTHAGSKGMIMPEPYGTVLIIAPWNYPLQLALSPLVGAIAAGNTVILKPSELTRTVSGLLQTILEEVFPPDYVKVVQGGPDVSTELLKQKVDYIFFTGSAPVGRIVMEASAKTLTPVTLELGGKSPCIVHHDADIRLAARRVAFGKFTNAGQTCVAPDYVWVHRQVKERFLTELKSVITEFYGERPLESGNYGRIVGRRHFDRLIRFLDNGKCVIGGEHDESALKIAPTVLEEVTWEMPVMQEEIFGPLLPVLEYEDLEQVLETARSLPKPLALYLFSQSRRVQSRITRELSFGGGAINDTLMHLATPYLPFGGVGESGMGSYHGYESFRTFSHEKSILKQTTKFDLPFRYPSSKYGLSIIRKLLR
ncbi:aldehyde dehydrogenase [Paenibacillus caui]|uniref:aldehyde dehydrogenase n=1 Tax=Paenibacillus caui TaxID=2873927 RepID=UPI003080A56C